MGASGSGAARPGPAPNRAAVWSHWAWTAELGQSTSDRWPRRRTISMASSVLPDPGGATRWVERRPASRSRSNASSASSW
jgi:hypothetical protein